MVRFTDLLSPSQQRHWLATGQTEETHERRRERDDLDPLYWERFARLVETPEAGDILALMRRYVEIALPDPARCEGRFWTCSCFTSKARTGDRDYARVNVNWQQVVWARSRGGSLVYTVYLARSPLAERLGDDYEAIPHLFAGVRGRPTDLVAGGPDQFCLESPDAHALLAAMDDADVRHGLRVLSLRLLNRGVCPFARHHNWFLADEIFSR